MPPFKSPASPEGNKEPKDQAAAPLARSRGIQIILVLISCLGWLACSSGIIIANRYIMVELDFHYPMAVAAMGMFISGLFSFFICDVFNLVEQTEGVDLKFYLYRIVPVGAAQGLAMWLSNNLYLLLNVSFIEMARAFLPCFTMLALKLAGLEHPSMELAKSVILIAIGCAISAYGEVRISMLGILCLLGNFTTEAGRLVMLQFLLQGCEFNSWQSLKLIAPAATATLAVMSYFLEYPDMVKRQAELIVFSNWVIFLTAASLGLGVNLLSNVIIKLSSATTVKVLAAVRGPLIVMAGVLLFSETVSLLQFCGYSIALIGFVWYNYARVHHPSSPSPRKSAG